MNYTGHLHRALKVPEEGKIPAERLREGSRDANLNTRGLSLLALGLQQRGKKKS